MVAGGDRLALGISEDLLGREALELGDGEAGEGGGDRRPEHRIGEGEGEIALDGLETGELAGGDLLEWQGVEGGEVDLGEEDGLAELAALALGLGELAEAGDDLGVFFAEVRGGAAAWLDPSSSSRASATKRSSGWSKSESSDSTTPLSSKMGASAAA
jgi:hypothetical protein